MALKEFRIIQTCSVCGEGFDTDYKLLKHMSRLHPAPEKAGWVNEDTCSRGRHDNR